MNSTFLAIKKETKTMTNHHQPTPTMPHLPFHKWMWVSLIYSCTTCRGKELNNNQKSNGWSFFPSSFSSKERTSRFLIDFPLEDKWEHPKLCGLEINVHKARKMGNGIKHSLHSQWTPENWAIFPSLSKLASSNKTGSICDFPSCPSTWCLCCPRLTHLYPEKVQGVFWYCLLLFGVF